MKDLLSHLIFFIIHVSVFVFLEELMEDIKEVCVGYFSLESALECVKNVTDQVSKMAHSFLGLSKRTSPVGVMRHSICTHFLMRIIISIGMRIFIIGAIFSCFGVVICKGASGLSCLSFCL